MLETIDTKDFPTAKRIYLDEDRTCSVVILQLGKVRKERYAPGSEAFDELWNLHPKEYGEIKIYGKTHKTPRWQKSYLRDYAFSGTVNKALPLPEEFQPFLDLCNDRLGMGEFSQVLINWYAKDEGHYIGPHSDDTKPLVPDSPIVTISLGGDGRIFRIKPKKSFTGVSYYDRLDVVLRHGCVLIMEGKMQSAYTHEVVKQANVESRISITFRQFK